MPTPRKTDRRPVRRHNLRARNADYSAPGIYFVTITLEQRGDVFGTVRADGVALNDIGRMIEDVWMSLDVRFPGVELDAFVVMPDHVHGVIVLGANPDVPSTVSLGKVVGAFKSLATAEYGRGVKARGWPPYQGHFWLLNYFERILRDEAELDRVRGYIDANPAALFTKWYER